MCDPGIQGDVWSLGEHLYKGEYICKNRMKPSESLLHRPTGRNSSQIFNAPMKSYTPELIISDENHR